jgi:hypothetical protein
MMIVAGTATAFVLYGKWCEKTASGPGQLAEAPDTQWPDPGAHPSPDRVDDPSTPEPAAAETPWPAMQFQTIVEPEPDEEPRPAPQPDAKDSEPPEPRPIDPAQQETFRKIVADARNSMAARDLAASRDHLAKAALNAQTDEEKARVGRLEKMTEYLGLFWDAIGQAVASLKSGEELTVADTVVIVVEAGADYVVVRAQGMNRRYATREIPHTLVVALADRWFHDTPDNKVLLGTYLAIDRKGDRARTRELWEEAAAEGINVSSLLPELEYSLGAGSGVLGGSPSGASSANGDAVGEARDLVRQRFQSDYDRATSLPRKAALAKKLFAAAGAAGDDPRLRSAMLREAQDLAVACGEPSLACQTIDALVELLAADWQIGDVLSMKTEALVEAGSHAVGSTGQKEVAQEALELLDQAVAVQRFDEARKLAPLAVDAAKKSKNTQLILQAAAAAERLAAEEKKVKKKG